MKFRPAIETFMRNEEKLWWPIVRQIKAQPYVAANRLTICSSTLNIEA